MISMENSKSLSQYLLPVGLVFGFIFTYFEVALVAASQPRWEKLLSPIGAAAIGIYITLLMVGLFCLIVGVWSIATLNRLARSLETPIWLRWPIVIGLILIVAWVYLYSSWQDVLTGPWAQLIFATGFAQIVLLLLAPRREQGFGWSEISLMLAIFLYPRIVHEVRSLTSVPVAYRGATVVGFIAILALAFVSYHSGGEWLKYWFLNLRRRMGSFRIWMAAFLWLTPLFYRLWVGAEAYILYANVRFAVLLIALWVSAYLTCSESDHLVSRVTLGLNFAVLILLSTITGSLLLAVDYPFSLSWSEGNRFYDYSLVFGQGLYNYPGHILNPYSSPGRYGLWGALFLFSDLPIQIHRLWNIILQVVPVLLFAGAITRQVKPVMVRYGFFLWIGLFLIVLAPLHPPFILASLIVAVFAFNESPVVRTLSLIVASLYASFSRFTWIFSPVALGVLIDLLLYYPKRQGTLIRRLFPTIVLAALPLLAGLFPTVKVYRSVVQGVSMANSQPLLWYRLLPNSTLGPGVLFLALWITGPVLILLAWWMSQVWKLDWIQKAAIVAVLVGFFSVGLIISTKIGGGGDLHNLDMYLMTLIVIVTLAVSQRESEVRWPFWAVGLVILLLLTAAYPFTPLSSNASYNPWLDLPKDTAVSKTLSAIRTEVKDAAKNGDVLFIDQRQLLTFGYLPAVPFVPEYEKKYMMDQAMGNNGRYFKEYYKDLAKKRFTLIVTEPLRSKLRSEMGGVFSEENDAWVTWVSNPTLCFYEPIYLSRETDVELLVPRANPVGCEQYLK
jgi:hypothetical protein